MRLRVAWAIVLLLSVPLAAEAMGFRRAGPPAVSYYSYYPATIVYVPVALAPVCPPPAFVPAPPPRVYATPTPAPPLGTSPTNPPPSNPGTPPPTGAPPAVKETRSYFDAYAVAGQEGKPVDGQRVSVGFWNNTNQELVLRIDGQARTLLPGKGVNVDVPRTFVWQVDQREPRSETVAADRSGLEIVIRR
jgi:hypothetical protein